jgi:spermidine/putrescine transport system permease protein
MAGAQAGTLAPGSAGEAGRGWTLLSPALAFAIVMLALPLAGVVAVSFWTQTGLAIERSWTLENYRIAIGEPIYRDLLGRSIMVSLVTGLATVILACPIAWYISMHGGARKALWLFLITLPFWTSYLLRIMAWKVILGQNGALNATLVGIGFIDEPLRSLLYNTPAVIVALTHGWAPFAVLPIFVSLEKLDRSLVEAASDLGDGALRRFVRVVLPLTLPGVLTAFLVVMIPTVGDYVTPRLVGGKDGVMISNAIQAQFGRAANWPLGAALSVMTMIAVTAIAGAVALAVRIAVRGVR